MSAQRPSRALLVVAHGSRREASNDEVGALALLLASRGGEQFHRVTAAFLERAEPSIPQGIMQSLGAGADEVVVLPFFRCAGRHVAQDIPEQVAIAQQHYPQATLIIAPYLGSAEGIAELMPGLVPTTPQAA